MPDYAELVVALSAVHTYDRKKHRATEVAGHLIVYQLKEKLDQLSQEELQEILQNSTDRLWDAYQNKRKDKSLSSKEAALQAIQAEIKFLNQEFNLKT